MGPVSRICKVCNAEITDSTVTTCPHLGCGAKLTEKGTWKVEFLSKEWKGLVWTNNFPLGNLQYTKSKRNRMKRQKNLTKAAQKNVTRAAQKKAHAASICRRLAT